MKSKTRCYRRNQILLTFIALGFGLSREPRVGVALTQSVENPRWEFLRANLSIFPGTERLFEPDRKVFWRLKSNSGMFRRRNDCRTANGAFQFRPMAMDAGNLPGRSRPDIRSFFLAILAPSAFR